MTPEGLAWLGAGIASGSRPWGRVWASASWRARAWRRRPGSRRMRAVVQRLLILSIAFIEALALYALVVAILLVGKTGRRRPGRRRRRPRRRERGRSGAPELPAIRGRPVGATDRRPIADPSRPRGRGHAGKDPSADMGLFIRTGDCSSGR